jgi:hypothetical protein
VMEPANDMRNLSQQHGRRIHDHAGTHTSIAARLTARAKN